MKAILFGLLLSLVFANFSGTDVTTLSQGEFESKVQG